MICNVHPVSPVFSAESRRVLLYVQMLSCEDAAEVLVQHKDRLCGDIARSLNAPWQIDGSVLLCAYMSRHEVLTEEARRTAVDLFLHKIVWTMDVFTVSGRTAMDGQQRRDIVNEMLAPAHELTLIKALRCLNRLLAGRVSLDYFALVENIEEMLVELESVQ